MKQQSYEYQQNPDPESKRSREIGVDLRVIAKSSSNSCHVDLSSARNDQIVNLGSEVGQGSRVDKGTKLEGSEQASRTILLENGHVVEDVTQCIEGCRESAERQLSREIAIFGSDEERVGARRKLRGITRDRERIGLSDNAGHDW
jgi:hypothetical protein